MQRKHPHTRLQQPVDQQPLRPLDRDDLDVEALKRSAQRAQPSSSCTKVAASNSSPAVPSTSTSCFSEDQSIPAQLPIATPHDRTIRQRPDPEVPLRVLIDKALSRGYVLSPLAAPHHRREGLVFVGPPPGQAIKALSRRRSRQHEACPISNHAPGTGPPRSA